MKITGGNVGGMNAKISPSGAIAVGRKYFPSNRVRAVQVVDREKENQFFGRGRQLRDRRTTGWHGRRDRRRTRNPAA